MDCVNNQAKYGDIHELLGGRLNVSERRANIDQKMQSYGLGKEARVRGVSFY